MEDSIKMVPEIARCEGMKSFQLTQRYSQVTGSFKHGNELQGSIKMGNLLIT
jgi:hypothetical protein